MLVLMRRVGQKIRIGEDVVVEVVAIRNGRVRVGIQAPAHVQVDREEVRQGVVGRPKRRTARDDR